MERAPPPPHPEFNNDCHYHGCEEVVNIPFLYATSIKTNYFPLRAFFLLFPQFLRRMIIARPFFLHMHGSEIMRNLVKEMSSTSVNFIGLKYRY